VARELGVDFFFTIRGRSVAFGTGMKLANPELKVVPFVGDLMTLGGNHTVHAGRRNMELTVICVNNFVYREVGGKPAPSGPAKFSAYSAFEQPFNVPHLANSCGALYTARWTALHTEELAESIAEGLGKNGFSVIEVLCPGPNFYRYIDDVDADLLDFYFENSEVKNGEEPKNVGITPEGKITVGKFTSAERATFIDVYNMQLPKKLGDKFTPYGVKKHG
jgi:2-oxoglutarate ferredoxin oxidoreductase subunit beta